MYGKRSLPKPEQPAEGYMINPVDIQGLPGVPSVGMPIDPNTIHWLAQESMKNWDEAQHYGEDYGMPRWNQDPSYNWRKKNGRQVR